MLSKTDLLENALRHDIENGMYPTGRKIPSRNALALKYRCSRTTVERAVRGLMQAGVLAGRQGSGTYVQAHSSSGHIEQLCVFAPEAYLHWDYVQPEMVFSEELLGIPVSFLNITKTPELMARFIVPRCGVIWLLPGFEQIFMMEFLRRKKVPQLLFNRDFEPFDAVYTDYPESFTDGLKWLLKQAGAEIAVVGHLPGRFRPYQQTRLQAFFIHAIRLGARLSPDSLFLGDFSDIPRVLPELCKGLFRKDCNSPRGIFVINRELTLPLVIAAQQSGFLPGRDYFLLTMDRVPELDTYSGVAMMVQRYERYVPAIRRWLSEDRSKSFRIALKTELLCAE